MKFLHQTVPISSLSEHQLQCARRPWTLPDERLYPFAYHPLAVHPPSTTLKRTLEFLCTCLDHPLLPRYRAKKAAQQRLLSRSTRNQSHSAFYRLPVELVLQITPHLAPADFLALQCSSRYAYAVLSQRAQVLLPRIFGAAQNELQRRTRRDAFTKACLAEMHTGTKHRTQLLCCNCYTTHARAAFTLHAQTQHPRRRACMQSSRPLRLCQHTQWTFDEFQTQMQAPYLRRLCVFCDVRIQRPQVRGASYVVAQQVGLCYLPVTVPPRYGTVQRALMACDVRPCVHLCAVNPLLAERVRRTLRLVFRMWYVPLQFFMAVGLADVFDSMLETGTRVRCEMCNASLRLKFASKEWEIRLLAERDLGGLWGPIGKTWERQKNQEDCKR